MKKNAPRLTNERFAHPPCGARQFLVFRRPLISHNSRRCGSFCSSRSTRAAPPSDKEVIASPGNPATVVLNIGGTAAVPAEKGPARRVLRTRTQRNGVGERRICAGTVVHIISVTV